MFEISDLIVGMWFLPVTLCIFIPLAIFFGWSITRLGEPMDSSGNSGKEDEHVIENEDFSTYKN